MVNRKAFFSYSLFLLYIFCSSLVACTTERNPCLEPKVPKLSISCLQYKSDGNTYIDTALPNANFISLDIDSAKFWYWGANALSKFDLVLSPLRDTSRWSLQADSSFSPIDTLTFIYERKLKFISNACGYSHEYLLKDIHYTQKNLDSVRILNNAVTTKAGTENVKIYF